MLRRISIATLTLALSVAAMPQAAFAEDSASPAAGNAQMSRIAAALDAPHLLNLQNAGRGAILSKEPAKQQSGRFLSTGRGQATLAAAIIVAAVLVAYKVSQGPDPTPATTR